jgi:hypothetical protein
MQRIPVSRLGAPVNRASNPCRFRLALALLLLGLSAAMVGAASREDLIGTWYGETQDNGQLDGVSFDSRRWTVVHTPDGTGMQIMRFYLGSKFQTEIVMSFVWGVDNNVWWVECSSLRDDRGLQDCSRIPRSDYSIESLDSGGMSYTSTVGGQRYLMRRVPRDFTIPR